MEIIQVAKKIEEKIKTLELGREILKERAQAKAENLANYDKLLAKTLIQLKNGVEFELEGEKIKDPIASVSEKIAKGIIFQAKLDMELSDLGYRNALVGMTAISAELSALQSIFRHLETTTEE